METKRYKVRYHQGNLVPMEPLDLADDQVVEAVFYCSRGDSFTETKLEISPQMMLSHSVLKKIWDNPEDTVYDDL